MIKTAPALGVLSTLFLFTIPASGQMASQGIYHNGWTDLNKNGGMDLYEDASQPIDERVEDLLARMTVEEKTMQLATLYGWKRVLQDPLPTPEWSQEIWKDGLGNIDEHINGNRYRGLDWPPSSHVETLNTVQRWFIEETRLGIPVDFTEEGIRGLAHTKATCFPSQLAVGATWDRSLVREIGRITGSEGVALGYSHIYSPIMDVPRDPRWGRTVECYGESPFLVTELAIQQARGLQSSGIGVSPKHFCVYSIPNGGRDGVSRTDPHVAPREMEQIHLWPWERLLQEINLTGAMSSYNDWDGEPVSGSSNFLIDILRNRMGFKGYVVSDSDAVEFLESKHRVEPDYQGAVRRFIESGGNIRTTFTHPKVFVEPLRKSIADGELPISVIDARVRDVLRVKFRLGLFDHPYNDPEAANDAIATDASRAESLRAARECIVLLKNADHTLPLDRTDIKRILVTGPNACEEKISQSRYGPQHGEVISVLEGIQQLAGNGIEVVYKTGSSHFDKDWPYNEVMDTDPSTEEQVKIDEAVAAAGDCDLVVAVLGDNDSMIGESRSRSSLDLPPVQHKLVRALHATGKPVVVVLLSGRPASINWIDAHCPAVLEGWFGGEFMGQAVAEALFGELNPGGKLPVTFPRSVGQIPLNFPHKPSAFADQGKGMDPNGAGESRLITPLYPFGFGLSYTTFEYSGLTIEPKILQADEPVRISAVITNTGKRAGDEIAQLYIGDVVSSVTTYDEVLRGFERIHLEPGESKTVTFRIDPKRDLWLIDRSRRRVVEPGMFDVKIGASSSDIRLSGAFEINGEPLDVGDSFWSVFSE
ncbi:MAG: glycoside hydrolase family 3 C-terminal domain-containing protein [Pontiellaceae bacterium]|nr:glycoside hydrolase family 3 C-terminal domain-containing protein [Pontiellaceae bacterium]MBN2783229.1 glycoside hydrolase family 3 C-terminal domain-containing protein [Pontiellaceae bacterium]